MSKVNFSNKAVVDINIIPDGWSLDRFIQIADETGYMFVDMSKSTNSESAFQFLDKETMSQTKEKSMYDVNGYTPISLEDAMNVLIEHLSKNEDYRMGWIANIAMAFQDEFEDWCKNKIHRDNAPHYIDSISNEAAKRFLDNLSYVASKSEDCVCDGKGCNTFDFERNTLKVKTVEITLKKHCYIRELHLWTYTFDGETKESPSKRIRFHTEDVSDFATQLDFTEIDDFKIID